MPVIGIMGCILTVMHPQQLYYKQSDSLGLHQIIIHIPEVTYEFPWKTTLIDSRDIKKRVIQIIKSFPDIGTVNVEKEYIKDIDMYVYNYKYYELMNTNDANIYYNNHFVGHDIDIVEKKFNAESKDGNIKKNFTKFKIGKMNDRYIFEYSVPIRVIENDKKGYGIATWIIVIFFNADNRKITYISVSKNFIM